MATVWVSRDKGGDYVEFWDKQPALGSDGVFPWTGSLCGDVRSLDGFTSLFGIAPPAEGECKQLEIPACRYVEPVPLVWSKTARGYWLGSGPKCDIVVADDGTFLARYDGEHKAGIASCDEAKAWCQSQHDAKGGA